MDGVFDIFGSLFEGLFSGEGLFDGVLSLFDMFGTKSEILGDVLAEGRFMGGIAESRGLWGSFEWVTNRVFEYQIWSDVLGNKGDYQHFRSQFTGKTAEELPHIHEVLTSHGFILQQLRAQKHHTKIAPLLKEYEALGVQLPSQELLKKAHIELTRIVHEGGSAPSPELWKQLNSANDVLKNTDKCAAYEAAVAHNTAKMSEWFQKIAGGEWDKMREQFQQAARKQIGHLKPVPEGIAKWFAELSPVAKGGAIFATVTGVGLGVYGLAHLLDKKHAKHEPDATWRHKIQSPQAAVFATSQHAL